MEIHQQTKVMQCFQLFLLTFSITILQSVAAYPLGIRVHALGKQSDSFKGKQLDYYESDNEAEYDDGDDDFDSNDRVEHYSHDAVGDEEYDDYDDDNDIYDEANDESFDETNNNHYADVGEGEENDVNDVEIDFSVPTKSFAYSVNDDDDDDDDDAISGYRPDVALTSPLEYYS